MVLLWWQLRFAGERARRGAFAGERQAKAPTKGLQDELRGCAMELFADVALLSRIQFAATVAYHFFFVPLSIGLGLILAINETRYYRSRN